MERFKTCGSLPTQLPTCSIDTCIIQLNQQVIKDGKEIPQHGEEKVFGRGKKDIQRWQEKAMFNID